MPEQIENGMLMPPEPRASDKWLRVCNECAYVYELCGHDNCPECEANHVALKNKSDRDRDERGASE